MLACACVTEWKSGKCEATMIHGVRERFTRACGGVPGVCDHRHTGKAVSQACVTIATPASVILNRT